MRFLFIIPTYNEVENIAILIPDLFEHIPEIHILVVDDNSPDGTADRVRQLQKDFPKRINLVVQKSKGGLRRAYVLGFKWAVENKFDWIFEMDADYSHTPKDAKKIVEKVKSKTADIWIGSRFLKGGRVVNWPFNRKILSFFALVYVRLVTGLPVYDPTAGFVCYNYAFLNAINLDNISCSGYGFQVEMKFVAWKLGFKIKEIPIVFENRKYGVSKMKSGIILEAISSIFHLEWKYLLGKINVLYKKKIL